MDGCLRTFGPSNVRRLEGDQGVGAGSGCWGLFVSNAQCPVLFQGVWPPKWLKEGKKPPKALEQWDNGAGPWS